MKKSTKVSGELALIESIQEASALRSPGRVRLGIGDDCAILRHPPGHEILVTTDFCLEGRHFRRDWHSPESAGHRCLARGLSDLAAMGALPLAAFLSLALPAGTSKSWVNGFFCGLRGLADEVQVPLAGGDTAESPSQQIIADIILVGSAPAGKALLRSTAKPGDLLYVTGGLGGSAAELLALKNLECELLKSGRQGQQPQLFPAPRLAVGATLLRRRIATACIDVSDGLSTDLEHLCDASEVAAEVQLDLLPLHELAKGELTRRRTQLALHGGEDYELLFAAKATTRVPRSIAGVPVTRIGRFLPKSGRSAIFTVDEHGRRRPLQAGGWEHFVS